MSNQAGPLRKLSTASNSTLEGNAASRRSSIGTHANLNNAALRATHNAAAEEWGRELNATAAANRARKNANATAWSKELDGETAQFTTNLMNEHFKEHINGLRSVEYLYDIATCVYESEEHMANLRKIVAMEGELYKHAPLQYQTLFRLFLSMTSASQTANKSRRRRIQRGGVRVFMVVGTTVTIVLSSYGVGILTDQHMKANHAAGGGAGATPPSAAKGAGAGPSPLNALVRLDVMSPLQVAAFVPLPTATQFEALWAQVHIPPGGAGTDVLSGELFQAVANRSLPVRWQEWAGGLRGEVGLNVMRGLALTHAMDDVRQTMITGLTNFMKNDALLLPVGRISDQMRSRSVQMEKDAMTRYIAQIRQIADALPAGNSLKAYLINPNGGMLPLMADLVRALGTQPSPPGWDALLERQQELKTLRDQITFTREIFFFYAGHIKAADLRPATLRFICTMVVSATNIAVEGNAPFQAPGAAPLAVIPYPTIPTAAAEGSLTGPLLEQMDQLLFTSSAGPLHARSGQITGENRTFVTSTFAYDVLQMETPTTLNAANLTTIAYQAEASKEKATALEGIVSRIRAGPAGGAFRNSVESRVRQHVAALLNVGVVPTEGADAFLFDMCSEMRSPSSLRNVSGNLTQWANRHRPDWLASPSGRPLTYGDMVAKMSAFVTTGSGNPLTWNLLSWASASIPVATVYGMFMCLGWMRSKKGARRVTAGRRGTATAATAATALATAANAPFAANGGVAPVAAIGGVAPLAAYGGVAPLAAIGGVAPVPPAPAPPLAPDGGVAPALPVAAIGGVPPAPPAPMPSASSAIPAAAAAALGRVPTAPELGAMFQYARVEFDVQEAMLRELMRSQAGPASAADLDAMLEYMRRQFDQQERMYRNLFGMAATPLPATPLPAAPLPATPLPATPLPVSAAATPPRRRISQHRRSARRSTRRVLRR